MVDYNKLRKPTSERQKELKAAATASLKVLKDARTNIRINGYDRLKLRQKAQEAGPHHPRSEKPFLASKERRVMARNNRTHQLPNKKIDCPLVKLDHENDFASIKLAQGVEAKSFERDGFLFSLDAKGKIIEVQNFES